MPTVPETWIVRMGHLLPSAKESLLLPGAAAPARSPLPLVQHILIEHMTKLVAGREGFHPATPSKPPRPPVLSVPYGAGWYPVARGASGTPWWGARQGGRTRGKESGWGGERPFDFPILTGMLKTTDSLDTVGFFVLHLDDMRPPTPGNHSPHEGQKWWEGCQPDGGGGRSVASDRVVPEGMLRDALPSCSQATQWGL